MRLLPELGLLRSDPLFDRSYPKSGSELTETSFSYGGCPVSKRKSDWISARIYYFPHHVTEYPDSTRVPENFWIFTRRILFGLDIYPRGSRVRPGLPTPKSG